MYAVNCTDAKAGGQNQRSMGIAPAAFAQWARSTTTGIVLRITKLSSHLSRQSPV